MESGYNLNVPLSLHEAVTQRAARELISTSDYVRRALLAQLQRDGIKLVEQEQHTGT
jgi:predicted HicB family RNase H-like nuclease